PVKPSPQPTLPDTQAKDDLGGLIGKSTRAPQASNSGHSETYGIPEGAQFLLRVLSRIKGLVSGHGISIDGIAHHQYQEAYTFRRGNEFARVDVGYSSKEKITRVTAPTPSELSSEVQSLL